MNDRSPLGQGPEQLAIDVQKRHRLRTLHLFARDGTWRVFGSRGDEKFQASVEEGGGDTIAAAIANLSARLDAGPINANTLAPLPRLQASEGGGSP